MHNLHWTHRLVSEFRQHRIAVKNGDDVLSLYDTLYRAYVSFPLLRQSALPAPATATIFGPANAGPIGSSDFSDDAAMMVDADAAPSASLPGLCNLAQPSTTPWNGSDDVGIPFPRDSTRS
jgi:hypothetical protein